MIATKIKKKLRENIRKKITAIFLLFFKGLGVPFIIILVLVMLVCYITDIFYIGISNEEKSNMKEEIRYYTTNEYTEEDTKTFFASVNEFILGIFGSEIIENAEFPVLGDYTITSYYGYRTAPTVGASTFHYGIDIAAKAGTKLIAISDGVVTKSSWYGSGGYTIMIDSGEYSFTYSHCDPNFIVHVGEKIVKGQVIGKVGPKNVYGVPNNPYKDSFGRPTNRCNYRKSLSLRSKEKWCIH